MRTVRTAKPKDLKAKDFYQTHPAMVQSLCNKYLCYVDRDKSILDPCSGNGVIKKVLRKNGFTGLIAQVDIEKKDDPRVIELDFFEYMQEINHKVDIIVMNPPYSNKYAFIDEALNVARDVFVLLPLDVSNYNHFHKNYLDTKEYKGRLLMTPKMMLHEGLEPKFGGNTSYAWYHFSNSNSFTNVKTEIYDDLRLYMEVA